MKFEEKTLTKICNFYVSDWHLVTMILPYINQKVNEEAKITTILEKDLEQNIKTLLEKLNLENKQKILEINWNHNEEIKKALNGLKKEQELIIFINGNKEFIDRQNMKIAKYFNTHIMTNDIKIINCYEIVEFQGSITEILDNHDKILNTSGEKEITDIFEDYKRKEEKQAM